MVPLYSGDQDHSYPRGLVSSEITSRLQVDDFPARPITRHLGSALALFGYKTSNQEQTFDPKLLKPVVLMPAACPWRSDVFVSR